jgi:peptidoglycan/xylan/chitin deacetylase (PgdA/CDA1 family)
MVAAAGAAVAAGALALRPPLAAVRALARAAPGVLFHVPTDRRAVALTLDDGPHPATTPPVLDVLAAHGARATFFLLGAGAREHPSLVARIAREGHELGNHTWRDEPAWRLSAAALERSVADTQRELAAHGPVRLLRPGSGWVTPRILAAAERHGLRCALGSVYPHDPWLRARRYLVWDVARRVRPGAVVILHEGRPERAGVAAVLDELLPRVRTGGLEVTTLSGLLAPPDAGLP